MRIREYLSSDLDALRRMHAAQNFGYPLPDLESPLLVSKLVLEEDVGEPGAPAVHRNSSASGSAELSAQRGPMNSEEARGDSASRAPRVTMAILQRLTVGVHLDGAWNDWAGCTIRGRAFRDRYGRRLFASALYADKTLGEIPRCARNDTKSANLQSKAQTKHFSRKYDCSRRSE